MANCGFCKQEVVLEGILSKKRRTSRTVIVERIGQQFMFSCPHCGSVLGFFYMD